MIKSSWAALSAGTALVLSLALVACERPQAPQQGQAGGRQHIQIAGSSTVFPFTTMIAEAFTRGGSFKAPIVESTGTGGGIKQFCSGVDDGYPDIVAASRRIKPSEVAQCTAAGVTEIVEVKLGYDGIVLAHSKARPNFPLTLATLYRALAANPGGEGPNATTNWRQLGADLPDEDIAVLGPPPTSGTRDAFNELIMQAGCVKAFPAMEQVKETDEARFKDVCTRIREDGKFIEAGENDNLIVQRLEANPSLIGAFGYSFLEENKDKIAASPLDGVEASYANISSGQYPVARSMYFYVKKARVGKVPGIPEFLVEMTKDSTWGPDGYLAQHGMIALPDDLRAASAAAASNLTPLDPTVLK